MKFLLPVACIALAGCASVVRVVDRSEDRVTLSYLPSRNVEAARMAQEKCAGDGRRAEFAWETVVAERTVATWNCEK
jgi:hypothetical protein